MAAARRRTTARSHLARHERFEQISPEVGVLDDEAVASAMDEDPDATLGLLAELTAATDVALRERARRLAGRLFVDLARHGRSRRRGVGRVVTAALVDGGDLDVDASIDALAELRATGVADPERLRVRTWRRPDLAVCLVVDRSGSMGGAPLATAALAAAAVAWRAPQEHAVLAFSRDVVTLRSMSSDRPVWRVVDDLLALRGAGTTDLDGALRGAAAQLSRSRAARQLTLLLSDCRATVHGDPTAAAAALEELVIVAPAADRAEADALACSAGARVVTVDGPSSVVAALHAAIDG